MLLQDIETLAAKLRENIGTVIVGKDQVTDLVLTALFSAGHVLLEDVPGTGKTQLSKALAKSFDCIFRRVQFTPDLLPSDLTGINYYSPKSGEFAFRRGSLFTNILLADEINRATPRTQSGLLESMEEKQITVDGETHKLESPYFVIATQNPIETQGTFPLPEAQMDRFIMQLSVGYPSTSEGTAIIKRFIAEDPAQTLRPVCDKAGLLEAQALVKNVYIHDELCGYITRLAEKTRSHEACALGVSPRGTIALARCCQSYAAIQGRLFVTPDDVKHLLPYVFGHRIILRGGMKGREARITEVLAHIVSDEPVPTENWRPVNVGVR